MREPQRRFQAFFVGKANYFFTKTFFFVDSLAPYVHFHKENGFPFTRKPRVGTGFLGVSNSSTYSNSQIPADPLRGGLQEFQNSCRFSVTVQIFDFLRAARAVHLLNACGQLRISQARCAASCGTNHYGMRARREQQSAS